MSPVESNRRLPNEHPRGESWKSHAGSTECSSLIRHSQAVEAGAREPSVLEQACLEFEAKVVTPPSADGWRDVDPARGPSSLDGLVNEEAGGAANV